MRATYVLTLVATGLPSTTEAQCAAIDKAIAYDDNCGATVCVDPVATYPPVASADGTECLAAGWPKYQANMCGQGAVLNINQQRCCYVIENAVGYDKQCRPLACAHDTNNKISTDGQSCVADCGQNEVVNNLGTQCCATVEHAVGYDVDCRPLLCVHTTKNKVSSDGTECVEECAPATGGTLAEVLNNVGTRCCKGVEGARDGFDEMCIPHRCVIDEDNPNRNKVSADGLSCIDSCDCDVDAPDVPGDVDTCTYYWYLPISDAHKGFASGGFDRCCPHVDTSEFVPDRNCGAFACESTHKIAANGKECVTDCAANEILAEPRVWGVESHERCCRPIEHAVAYNVADCSAKRCTDATRNKVSSDGRSCVAECAKDQAGQVDEVYVPYFRRCCRAIEFAGGYDEDCKATHCIDATKNKVSSDGLSCVAECAADRDGFGGFEPEFIRIEMPNVDGTKCCRTERYDYSGAYDKDCHPVDCTKARVTDPRNPLNYKYWVEENICASNQQGGSPLSNGYVASAPNTSWCWPHDAQAESYTHSCGPTRCTDGYKISADGTVCVQTCTQDVNGITFEVDAGERCCRYIENAAEYNSDDCSAKSCTPAGHGVSTDGRSCVQCPEGQGVVDGKCAACGPGNFGIGGECSPCAAGTFSASPEVSECDGKCEEGKTSPVGSQSVDDCVANASPTVGTTGTVPTVNADASGDDGDSNLLWLLLLLLLIPLSAVVAFCVIKSKKSAGGGGGGGGGGAQSSPKTAEEQGNTAPLNVPQQQQPAANPQDDDELMEL